MKHGAWFSLPHQVQIEADQLQQFACMAVEIYCVIKGQVLHLKGNASYGLQKLEGREY